MRMLQNGGIIEIIMPNLDFHIKQLTSKENIPGTVRNYLSHGLAGLYGWQKGSIDELWDVHKSGYNKEIFTDIANKLGIENIVYKKTRYDRDLHIIITK